MAQTHSRNEERKSRWLRFSLRTAFILVTLLCVALGRWVMQAARQKQAVASARDAGAIVHYTYEFAPDGGFIKNPAPWAPVWLRKYFGEDLFITLDGVYLEGAAIDDTIVANIAAKLQRVSTLRWLELRDTSISDSSLEHIASLPQLKRVLIRSSEDDTAPRTRISDKGLSQLKSLYRLNLLSLGDCTIDGSAFAALGTLRRLEEIDLRDTEFNDAAAYHLRQFPHLRYVNLWRTPITDSAINEIACLSRLEELYLDDTKITDRATTHIAKLKRLKVLDLSGTKISDSGVEQLRPLSELKELRLANSLIEGAKVDAFPNLEDLQIGSTRANDSLLEIAGRMPKLRYLDCCDCQYVTDAGLKHLEKSKSLERFFFPDRQVISNEALRSLQQAKPKLVIDF